MDRGPLPNFGWLIPGELAGSSFPRDAGAVRWLADVETVETYARGRGHAEPA